MSRERTSFCLPRKPKREMPQPPLKLKEALASRGFLLKNYAYYSYFNLSTSMGTACSKLTPYQLWFSSASVRRMLSKV